MREKNNNDINRSQYQRVHSLRFQIYQQVKWHDASRHKSKLNVKQEQCVECLRSLQPVVGR